MCFAGELSGELLPASVCKKGSLDAHITTHQVVAKASCESCSSSIRADTAFQRLWHAVTGEIFVETAAGTRRAAAEHRTRGNKLRDRKRWHDAARVTRCRSSSMTHPSRQLAHHELGIMLVNTRQARYDEESLSHFERACALHEHPILLQTCARALVAVKGDNAKAALLLRRALELDAALRSAKIELAGLGEEYAKTKDERACARAEQLRRVGDALRNEHKWADARAAYEKSPTSTASTQATCGTSARWRGTTRTVTFSTKTRSCASSTRLASSRSRRTAAPRQALVDVKRDIERAQDVFFAVLRVSMGDAEMERAVGIELQKIEKVPQPHRERRGRKIRRGRRRHGSR